MQLNTSYKQILSISFPIMLGSAAQNIIVLCDNVFLYHYGEIEFGAIALVGVFYLVIASIGYGFSRGGQIIIARRYGEGNNLGLKKAFHALFLFEALIACILFLLLQFGASYFFDFFVESEDYYDKCLEYIYPRSYGIIFSYIGVSFIALYTGIARTKFILYDTIILVVVNLILNYIFIFGHLGLEPMGIVGAAWASTIAEIVAFVVFVVFMLTDSHSQKLRLFTSLKFDYSVVKQMFFTSTPILLQSILGLGSWFVFFSFIEKYLGGDSLGTSNLVRNVYLILSIPCWGFSAGINTIVSNYIGQRKRYAVFPIIKKTAFLNLVVTLCISIPVLMWPEFFLYPLFGTEDMTMIIAAKPILRMLLGILSVFCVGAIFMNGMIGIGVTKKVLMMQVVATCIYLSYSYVTLAVFQLDVVTAWSSELIYWAFILLVCWWYVRSRRWYSFKM